MKLEELKKMAKKGESSTLEFKKSTSKLKEAFQTICGLLNNKGGKVLIGVYDNGKICGQEIADSTKKDIALHVKRIEPSANIDIEYIKLDENKYIILLEVFGDQNIQKPYVYDGRPYQRIESTTTVMKQAKYHELLYLKKSCFSDWDSQPSNYTYSPKVLKEILDEETIRKQFIARGVEMGRMPAEALHTPIVKLFSKLGLICDSSKKAKTLTNAALVLFGRELEAGYPQCVVKMARFKGKTKVIGFIDNKRFHGNAFAILNQAEKFIKSYLPIASSFSDKSFQRNDEPAVPFMAMREALVNAICHREYADRGGEIAVAIYDDRIEIWSRGKLPNKLTPKKLTKAHESCPRNKLIAEAFFKSGYIEKWGSGTLRIMEFCKKQGAPKPIYTEYSGGFSVEFKFKEAAVVKRILETTVPADVSTPPPRLTERQKNILAIIEKLGGETQSKDIMGHIDIPYRTLQRELNKLRELKLIESTGSTRNTVWKLEASIDKDLGES